MDLATELRLSCTNPLIYDDSTYHTNKFCFLLLNGWPEHWIHVSGLSVGVSVVTRPSWAAMDHMQHFYQMIYFKALLAFQGHFYSIIDFVLFCNRWWNWSINQSNTAIHIIYSNQLQGHCIIEKIPGYKSFQRPLGGFILLSIHYEYFSISYYSGLVSQKVYEPMIQILWT